MNDWPHQTKAVADTLSAIEEGKRRLVLCSPTGGGKTRIAQRLIEHWQAKWVRMLSTRTASYLVDQLGGLPRRWPGVGYPCRRPRVELGCALQICSVQTEMARKRKWYRFPAQRVIVDEAHLQTGPGAESCSPPRRRRRRPSSA